MLAISGLMCGLPSCVTHSVLQACRAYQVEVNGRRRRGGKKAGDGVSWLKLGAQEAQADITVSCFKNTLFFLIFFYYMLTNETEGGLFDVRVWVTW